MTRFDIKTLESDLHRLDLRFASQRMRQSQVVDRLASAIEQNGQLVQVECGHDARTITDVHVGVDTDRWFGHDFIAFVWRCLNSRTITPFPHPPHRTGVEPDSGTD